MFDKDGRFSGSIAKDINSMRRRGLGAFKHDIPEQEVIDGIKGAMTTKHLREIADYIDDCESPDSHINHLAIEDPGSGDWIRIKLLAEIMGFSR